ncbi:acyl-CoA thioesterase [Microterricola pindariensis]|uniref:4-hydroxybenzoyl-CoA thioesterase n=1 Tax=Microterricola pindariensis TaxID=478010 RepID=A0ABX5AUN7_9MICO|nr:thioesterase family protein [Microterricola pindariensis]PPL18346.1 4-hydroxybenzoyl-CoA thioesterase [Microterricola pindariensis]
MRLHVPIRLRWSDLDAYGHVNNAEMLRLLEEARIQAFWADDAEGGAQGAVGASTAVLDARPGAATLSLIARQEIEYLAPIPYLRAPMDVELWIGNLGGASLEVCYQVWSPESTEARTLYTRAATTIVLVDSVTERPRRISAEERAAWTPYLEDPVQFAKRR